MTLWSKSIQKSCANMDTTECKNILMLVHQKWLIRDDAEIDSDGYFYTVDRLKELIWYRSNAITSAEIEVLLRSHHTIKDACVIGFRMKNAVKYLVHLWYVWRMKMENKWKLQKRRYGNSNSFKKCHKPLSGKKTTKENFGIILTKF